MSETTNEGPEYDPDQDPDSDPDMLEGKSPPQQGVNERDPAEGAVDEAPQD